ncbi:hypothetical protein KP509_39G049100 [Ceratopteris richardii]|uniref:tRNA-2-methylthio-N(6)-dimethylallyladenosine synthase n=2 Tax=Ceratopteris richardii TaxID=49495 RepID=A0A8T2Q0E1_CERRI|nr:hypothetical protein KP509_39G049100 [Ceratopteris richardii]
MALSFSTSRFPASPQQSSCRLLTTLKLSPANFINYRRTAIYSLSTTTLSPVTDVDNREILRDEDRQPSFSNVPSSPSQDNQLSYHIITMGCQMNQADSERMAGQLEAQGYRLAPSVDECSLLILNTCSIRDRAEQKVYGALGRQKVRKYQDPDFRIVVSGCVAQQEGNALLRRVPEVDLVMGPQHVGRLTELLEQVELGSQVCALEPIYIMEDITKPRRDSSVSAWVNIIYGCNEGCTYCVVPGTRGKEQSRLPDAIRKEMLALGEAGYKEVTLLGQNIDAYGRDLGLLDNDSSSRQRWTLADLLLYVHDVPGIERIRFVTSHPKYFTEKLIKTCKELPKVCEYFNIPFQSGDNDILKEMKRGYTREKYLNMIQMIRHYMPDASISADAIVGFPGETEEQFCNTLSLMEEVKFDAVNTAAYSPRPRTPAALWDNQVADLVKEDRLHRINRLVSDHALERSQRYLGRVENILVEAKNPRPGKEDQVMGRTGGNKVTFFKGGPELIGSFVNVKITDVTSASLRGERV